MTKKQIQINHILAYFKANPGKRFSVQTLKLPEVSIDTTRAALKELVADMLVDKVVRGKNVLYKSSSHYPQYFDAGYDGYRVAQTDAVTYYLEGPDGFKEGPFDHWNSVCEACHSLHKVKDPAPAKKESTAKKGWKMRAIRHTLQAAPGYVPREALMQLTGSTARNVHIMISIIKNPERTKDPVAVVYNKAERAYAAF